MSSSESSGHSSTGPATHIVDAVVAALVVVMGATVAYGSRKLGAGWTSDGPAAGYFPFYIGLLLSISGLGIMVQALFGKKKNTAVFVDGVQIKRVLSVLIPACFYVLAIQLLGIYVASTLYIALFMVILGKYSWLKSVLTAVIVDLLFYLMFEVWFMVPLFKGKFDLLSALGL